MQVQLDDPIAAFLKPGSTQYAISTAYGRVGELTINARCDDKERDIVEFRKNQAVYCLNETENPSGAQSFILLRDSSVDNKAQEQSHAASWRTVFTSVQCETPKRSTFPAENELRIDQGDGNTRSLSWSSPQSQNMTTWAADDGFDCGPRCTKVMALVPTSGVNSTDQIYNFYDCNSTMLQIQPFDENAEQTFRNAPNSQIPDPVARIFAGAIGSEMGPYDDQLSYSQFPLSPKFGLVTQTSSTKQIELLISMFSTYSVGGMDRHGNKITIDGFPPRTLQTLAVQWHWVIPILAGLPMAQLLIVIIITLLSASAVIKDTSFIAAAQLLKPALDDLGSQGSVLTGDEIADHLGKAKLCYGVREIGGTGEYFVDVIKQEEWIEHRQGTVWWPGRKMPQGLYDGPEKRQGDGYSRSSSNW